MKVVRSMFSERRISSVQVFIARSSFFLLRVQCFDSSWNQTFSIHSFRGIVGFESCSGHILRNANIVVSYFYYVFHYLLQIGIRLFHIAGFLFSSGVQLFDSNWKRNQLINHQTIHASQNLGSLKLFSKKHKPKAQIFLKVWSFLENQIRKLKCCVAWTG